MKIAVTYENGEIFQHFGHSEAFKLYEVEGGEVKSSEVVPTNGSGHGALAGFLRERGVEVLICGGIGAGAQTNQDTICKCRPVSSYRCDKVFGRGREYPQHKNGIYPCKQHKSKRIYPKARSSIKKI